MPKKVFCIYSNCQGPSIWKALACVPGFLDEYEMRYHANYIPIDNDHLKRDLACADVILYQPLKQASIDVRKCAKDGAVFIDFPYIYCDWLWPFYINQKPDGAIFYDGGVIRALRNQMYSNESIMSMFQRGEIDFKLCERRKDSIEILRSREQNTAIKVADFILEHHQKLRLFHITNHPSHHVFIHCAKQVLVILGYDFRLSGSEDIGVYNDCKFWPVPECTKRELTIDYANDNHNDKDHAQFFESMLRDVLHDFRDMYPKAGALKLNYFDHMNHELYSRR